MDENMTTDLFVSKVVGRVVCKKHKATLEEACFYLARGHSGTGDFAAVCNNRAKKAGFIGKIQSSSLRRGVFHNGKAA